MSVFLKFWISKIKTITFLEENYLIYTKKDTILHVTITFSLDKGKQEQASSYSAPKDVLVFQDTIQRLKITFNCQMNQSYIHP